MSALNTPVYDDSVFDHIIEEIKFQARLNFTSFVCVHVNRNCNEAAHELASLSYLCTEGNGVIADSVPDVIAIIVADNLLANE